MPARDTVSPAELRELAEAMQCPTQELFAEVLGVSQAYVSYLFSGERSIKPGPLLHLVHRLQAEYMPGRKRRA